MPRRDRYSGNIGSSKKKNTTTGSNRNRNTNRTTTTGSSRNTNKNTANGSISGAVTGVFGNSGNSNLNNWRNTTSGGTVSNTVNKSNAVNGALAGALGGAVGGALNYGNSNSGSYSGGSYTQPQVEMPTDVGALPTYDSSYMDQLNSLARQLTSMNYEDWTKGSQYQSLADRYGDNGRLSMQDVLGQIASRTGGLASSYATTAAQQQYNQYMAQLEEVARQMYSQERGDIMDTANLYRNLANDEYDRYRDSLADYNDRLAAAQQAARSAYSGSRYAGTTSIDRLKSRSGNGGSGGSGNARYSSGTALNLATGNARTTSGQVMALEAMYENGNITKKQYSDLVYALRNPGR